VEKSESVRLLRPFVCVLGFPAVEIKAVSEKITETLDLKSLRSKSKSQ
jgi:hypothetical protein